jgi:hypothetical protein
MNRARGIFLVWTCAALLLWAACARREQDINRNLPDNAPPIIAPPAPANAGNANAANLNANTPVFPATNAATVTELQDSVITSTNDNLGNRIETRVFRAHPRLSQVVVLTPVKGRKQARVYGNKGEVRELPANVVINALIYSGDDLADAVGIAMDKSPKRQNQLPPLEKASPTPKPEPTPTPKPKPAATPAGEPEP